MSKAASFDELKSFVESEQGRQFLEGIRSHLKGHTIVDVEFIVTDASIMTILRLNNGQCYAFNDEELFLEALREQFSGLFRQLAGREAQLSAVSSVPPICLV